MSPEWMKTDCGGDADCCYDVSPPIEAPIKADVVKPKLVVSGLIRAELIRSKSVVFGSLSAQNIAELMGGKQA